MGLPDALRVLQFYFWCGAYQTAIVRGQDCEFYWSVVLFLHTCHVTQKKKKKTWLRECIVGVETNLHRPCAHCHYFCTRTRLLARHQQKNDGRLTGNPQCRKQATKLLGMVCYIKIVFISQLAEPTIFCWIFLGIDHFFFLTHEWQTMKN